jgi:hypothetical protein
MGFGMKKTKREFAPVLTCDVCIGEDQLNIFQTKSNSGLKNGHCWNSIVAERESIKALAFYRVVEGGWEMCLELQKERRNT